MTLPTLATALPVGVAFGFMLERAGLGDPRVIAAQFTGKNFAVVRVMFGAIVTALLGVWLLGNAGIVDVSSIAIPPTNIAAQTVGAIVFGGGFALASLCPGTACVAAASGKRDGVVAVIGLLIGTAATALIWPAVGTVMNNGLREGARLPTDLGISTGIVVTGVVVLCVFAMTVARRFSGHEHWQRPSTIEWVALSLAVSLWMTETKPQQSLPRLAAIAAEISNEADHVDPLELADWIKDGKRGLRIIDVREGVDSNTYVIPGAKVMSLDSLPFVKISSGDLVVLYSEGGAHAAQAWVLLRARGATNVRVLKDGMAAWEDEVMSPAQPLHNAASDSRIATESDTAAQRFKRARALSMWFGGRPRMSEESSGLKSSVGSSTSSAVPVPSRKPASVGRRRNTC